MRNTFNTSPLYSLPNKRSELLAFVYEIHTEKNVYLRTLRLRNRK